MTPQDQQPISTPMAQRLEDFKRRTVPLLVWGVAALICVALLWQRGAQHEFIGMARTHDYRVSVETPGTVQDVLVDLFDPIEAGDVVARLDEAVVVAGLQTARATVGQLTAELEAARAGTLADDAQWTAELRRFQMDEEQRRLQALELRVVIEEDEIELERLGLEVNRNRVLVEQGLVGQQEFDILKLRADQVRERITRNRELLAQVEEEIRITQGRRARYEAELPGAEDRAVTLEPLREAIHVAQRQVDELEVIRRALVLRSPVSGQVSELLCRRGQAVVPGEPILTVSERAPREIVAYLAESTAARANDRVLVSRRRDPSKSAESLVVRVSPTIQPLPERLWVDPRRPDYGRAVVIAGVPGLELVPGELVSVRLLGP